MTTERHYKYSISQNSNYVCQQVWFIFTLTLILFGRKVIKCNTDTAMSWENFRWCDIPVMDCLHPHVWLIGLGTYYESETNTLIYLRQWLSEPCHLRAVAFIVILLRNHLLKLLLLYSYAIKRWLQKRMHCVGRKVRNKDQMDPERIYKTINFSVL